MGNFRLLSTKILEAHQRNRFVHLGIDYFEHAFLNISPLSTVINIPKLPLIFTSQNAVNAVFSTPTKETYECYCVGEKTQSLLIRKGQNVLKMTQSAHELALFLSQLEQKTHFLFFTGNHRRPDIETLLTQSKHQLSIEEVYQSQASPKIFKQIDGVLFFSPRGVKSFLSKNTLVEKQAFALGETTANALEPYTQAIAIAKKPTVEHLLILVKKHIQNLC